MQVYASPNILAEATYGCGRFLLKEQACYSSLNLRKVVLTVKRFIWLGIAMKKLVNK